MPGADEELDSLKLDRPMKGRSDGSIKHFDIGADVSGIDRCLILLNKGDESQKIIALNSVPRMAVNDKTVYNKVLPKVISILPQSSTEFQIAVSNMFRSMNENNLAVTPLLQGALNGLQHKDPSVVQAWTEALLEVMPSLNSKILQGQVLPFIMKETKANINSLKKITYVKIFGAIAQTRATDANVIETSVIPIFTDYIQDVSQEVRGTTCLQFPNVAKSLSLERVNSILVPLITQLGKDTNPIVKGSLLTIIGPMTIYFSSDTIKVTIIPLLLKLMDSCVGSNDDTKIIVAKEIGTYCNQIGDYFGPKELSFVVNCYHKLSVTGLTVYEMKRGQDPSRNVACRTHCATNLPIMTAFILSKAPNEEDVLNLIVKSLIADPCFAVRKIIASQFQDFAKALGTRLSVKDFFILLLKDGSDDVLICLVSNISRTLHALLSSGILQTKTVDNNILDVSKSLLKCHANVFKLHDWRTQTIFLRQLEYLPAVFPSDYINAQYLPSIFGLISKSGTARPIRQQAGRTVLIFLRYNMKQEQRRNIRNRIIAEIARHPSCFVRIIYVKLCTDLFELFSSQYFKEHFADVFFQLADDRIANIRLLVFLLLPRVKRMLVRDEEINKTLETLCKSRLMNEKDKECKKILASILLQISQIKDKSKQMELRDKQLYDEEIKFNVFD